MIDTDPVLEAVLDLRDSATSAASNAGDAVSNAAVAVSDQAGALADKTHEAVARNFSRSQVVGAVAVFVGVGVVLATLIRRRKNKTASESKNDLS